MELSARLIASKEIVLKLGWTDTLVIISGKPFVIPVLTGAEELHTVGVALQITGKIGGNAIIHTAFLVIANAGTWLSGGSVGIADSAPVAVEALVLGECGAPTEEKEKGKGKRKKLARKVKFHKNDGL